MKTKEEVLRILEREKPELTPRYGLKRLALFGSYAREEAANRVPENIRSRNYMAQNYRPEESHRSRLFQH
jgi:ATP-dependent RNA circularization protein (DNA/RNA ligase family)